MFDANPSRLFSPVSRGRSRLVRNLDALVLFGGSTMGLLSCSGDEPGGPENGAEATGGQVSGGQSSAVTGGTSASGGGGTGGTPAWGGSGGSPSGATGGSGARTTGGTASTGGAPASGGAIGSGGGDGAGGSSAVTCPSTVIAPGDSTQMVQVGSSQRSYYLHIPTGYTGDEPLPVVIDFHPLGGTGQQQANSNSWKSKADSVGFITVYPNSYSSNNSWNVGWCCQDAEQNQIDDVEFTRKIVEHLKQITCVDPRRIFATGCSNGGGMTYKVACEAADIIAAGAPVDFRCVNGGTQNSPSCVDGCEPARPISITHFDNTGDTQLVPFQGGTTAFPANCPPNMSCVGMAFPSADANYSTWQQIDGCSGSPESLDGHSECQTNDSCEGGVQVSMCVRQGGSHCGNYSALGIVDTAWEMFEHQAMP